MLGELALRHSDMMPTSGQVGKLEINHRELLFAHKGLRLHKGGKHHCFLRVQKLGLTFFQAGRIILTRVRATGKGIHHNPLPKNQRPCGAWGVQSRAKQRRGSGDQNRGNNHKAQPGLAALPR